MPADEHPNQIQVSALARDPELQQAYQAYLEIVVRLPNVEIGTSDGLPAVRVGGKLLSRLRVKSDRALALRYEIVERERLIAQSPAAFFVPEIYRNYPLVLVRLDQVDATQLSKVVARAYEQLTA